MSARVRIRPDIAALAPYRQGKQASGDAFKLSSNENPFDPLPAVREVVASSALNRYPDAMAGELRERLAMRFGVETGQVHVGAGSVSLLAQFITAAAAPGDEVVYSWPSFEAYPDLVAVAGASAVEVPNTPDHGHDLPRMAAAITDRTRVIIVCNPNNPTGTVVSEADFAVFMARVPADVLVLLDEAYIEFATDESAVRGSTVLERYPNLVVLRTFSKAYGLAGLRIGYAVGPAYLMDAARSVAIPLSVTEPAQRAALVSLDHEPELLERVGAIARLRDEVWSALVEQGWRSPRPHGNFVWLPTGSGAAEAADVFARHDIVVRPLGDGVRVTIGEPEAVQKLLAASAEVVRSLRVGAQGAGLD